MIKSAQEPQVLIVGVMPGTDKNYVIDIVEKETNGIVQTIHEITRGAVPTFVTGQRVVYQVSEGVFGSSRTDLDTTYFAVTYFKDAIKSFARVIRTAEKEIREKEKARQKQIDLAGAKEAIEKAERLRKDAEKANIEAVEAAKKAGIELDPTSESEETNTEPKEK